MPLSGNKLVNLLAAAGTFFILSCGGASPNSGVTSMLQVANAQFYEGSPPMASGGPAVRSLSSSNNQVFPGTKSADFSGSVLEAAEAIVVGLEGDNGYWSFPAGPTDPFEVGARTFDARLSFSRAIKPGSAKVFVQAVDQRGQVGPPNSFSFKVVDDTPVGALVVSLEWSSDADLDLHLLMPNPQIASFPDQPNVEIWSHHPSSYRRASDASISEADALKSAALLDFDSNASCTIDGRRRENIVIAQSPPFGSYTVRVDTASLCGQAAATWQVRLLANGVEVRSAKGVAVSTDGFEARGNDPVTGKQADFGEDLRPGTAGAGAFALQFDY